MASGLTIAVTGKGGVGKTFVSALLIRRFSEVGSVLAIDGDADSNLPNALGVTISKTIGDTREEILNTPARSEKGKRKQESLALAAHEAIEEFPNFDLYVMGRPEGQGCYCPVNYIVRQVLDSRARGYDFTVVDCDAGMEHLSRYTTRDVDIMLIVAEPTKNAIETAARIRDLAQELQVEFEAIMLVANKLTEQTQPLITKMTQQNDLQIAAYVPYDPLVGQFDIEGKSVMDFPEDSPAFIAVNELFQKILDYRETGSHPAVASSE
ncbi:MAG: AAA family ATPase [Proteobacteria bacterium]|nr:AAA family ATPase [Pseudomonadota bacterium]